MKNNSNNDAKLKAKLREELYSFFKDESDTYNYDTVKVKSKYDCIKIEIIAVYKALIEHMKDAYKQQNITRLKELKQRRLDMQKKYGIDEKEVWYCF